MKMQGDGWMGRREGRGSDRLCVAPNICVILREYNIHLYGTFGSARVLLGSSFGLLVVLLLLSNNAHQEPLAFGPHIAAAACMISRSRENK